MANSEEKLAPCPFCGGIANAPEFYGESKTAKFINCRDCGANIYRAHPGENDEVLIAAWNRRDELEVAERAAESDRIDAYYAPGKDEEG